MPFYHCKVTDKQGKMSEFTKESSTEDALLRELAGRDLFPLSVREYSPQEAGTAPVKRFRPNAVLDFTDTISLLLSSGLSLKDSLQVAGSIFTKGHAHLIITGLLEKINKGLSFHDALEGFGPNFPP
ncbi:MAG TPA: hypothetical protein ENN69_04405, partial [Spirochaetia bacterium]|nr:hypothetical protein [Spirochaetia bacterium]